MRHLLVLVFVLLFGAVPAAVAGTIIVGADAGAGPQVNTFDGKSSQQLSTFLAYSQDFTGGVRVATGDVNGDGVQDIITGAGAGGGPHVKVFDGISGNMIQSFFAYDATYTGGINVAAADVDGDGYADIIVGQGPTTGSAGTAPPAPSVRVFNGRTDQLEFELFFNGYEKGGITVAAGDVNGDGRADIITGAGAGGGPHVQVFDGRTHKPIRAFDAFDSSFTGGVYVAAGDLDGDGHADIITGAGAGGGPHVKVFDGATGKATQSFDAYASDFTGGVRVATGDVNGDGKADIITGAGAGGGPHVKAFDGRTNASLDSFFAFDAGFTGGVYVAGGSKGATDQIPDLHGLVTSFALDKSLDTYFQNKISDVQKGLGTDPSSCTNILIGLLLPAVQKAGKLNGMLQYAEAQHLAAATNSILIGLSCTPSNSTEPLVVNELIGLLDSVDSSVLPDGMASQLIGLLRKAGSADVTGGSVCQPLADVRTAVAALVPRSSPQVVNILIGLLLPAVQKISDDSQQCRAGVS